MNTKNLLPFVGLKHVHPFKIDWRITKKGGQRTYNFAVNYHSKIYRGTSNRGQFLEFDILPISGLDFIKEAPSGFPQSRNLYCVLTVRVSNLQAQSAKIEWILGDDQQDELAPIKFEDTENYKQTEARVIIGVAVRDLEASPGLVNDTVKTVYIIQYVNTNLIMANMVFNGVPVTYPVPISGGRLNPGSFGGPS
jgi:hypothetical protein